MNRRSFLSTPLLAAAQVAAPARLKPRASKAIAASPVSIGFETLDRRMFDPERTYSHLAESGVKWARCQTGWARTERSKGEYDFGWLDGVVDSLLRIGVQPWFNLGYGNTLYTPGAKHESAVGWAPLNSPEARQAWTRFVEKMAERYATRVKHWELWNEPNIPNFWQPDKPDPARYIELVKLTAPVLRKRIPEVTLIGGAFAGLPFDYIDACFAAGLGEIVDKVSYHPYRPIPELHYAAEIRALRGIVNRYKPGMPLWQGENGAPSFSGGTGAMADLAWTEEKQAKWLLRRLITDLNLGIEVTSYFHCVDMVNYVWAAGQSGKTNAKGVLRGTDYSRKPSFQALQNVCTLFDSDTKRADLLARFERLAAPSDALAMQSAVFVRNGSPMYAWWNAADLMKDYTPSTARLATWHGGAGKLESPVLVDMLTGEISKPTRASKAGGGWNFDGLPVRDYPMLVTDAAAVS